MWRYREAIPIASDNDIVSFGEGFTPLIPMELAGREVKIHLRGGDLSIEWKDSDNHVYMTGPAVEVFAGEWPG